MIYKPPSKRHFIRLLLCVMLMVLIAHTGAVIKAQGSAQFTNEFGDRQTDYGGQGGLDDYLMYHPPSAFITWVEETLPAHEPGIPPDPPRAVQNSDNNRLISDTIPASGNNYPFILTRHPRFDPSQVRNATLRVDVYYPVLSTPGNDMVRFWDEQDTTGDYAVAYRFGIRLDNLLIATGNHVPQWISMDINLQDNTAFAYELDPLTGGRLGLIGSLNDTWAWGDPRVGFEQGSPQDVLTLAADGSLYGVVEDDTYLSFVSLTVEVDAFVVNSTADEIDTNPGDGVCATGAGECTLRAAIMETNALPGPDTISLPAGTYDLTRSGIGEDAAVTGDLDVNDDLVLIGADANQTVIDIHELDRVFDINPGLSDPTEAIDVHLSGITVRQGLAVDLGPVYPGHSDGGGIRYAGHLTMTDAIIRDNVALSNGGGLAGNSLLLSVSDPRLTLDNVIIRNNHAPVPGNEPGRFFGGEGGGIYATNYVSLEIVNSAVLSNTAASFAGGISATGLVEPPILTGVTVVANKTGPAHLTGGGGIFGSCMIISGSLISGNKVLFTDVTKSGYGGGIVAWGDCDTIIVNSEISLNEAYGLGGGVVSAIGGITLENVAIYGNSTMAEGGGIGISNDGSLTMTNSELRLNQASSCGGGITKWGSGTAVLHSTIITENSAHDGGGICNRQGFLMVIAGSVLEFNHANESSGYGGGLFNGDEGQLFFSESIASFNEAPNGGGIYNEGILKLFKSTLHQNRAFAGYGGAGILNLATLQIDRSSLSLNVGERGGGISNGTTDHSGGNVVLTNSTIAYGAANQEGGAVANYAGGQIKILNSTISGNEASDGGGIANVNGGQVDIKNATIAYNLAYNSGGGVSNFGIGGFRANNSIIANNTGSGDCSGSIINSGFNLDSDGTCDFLSADPLLGPLALNPPGTTATHALIPGSPAVNTGSCTLTGVLKGDQRGVPRPQQGGCDLGAFEQD